MYILVGTLRGQGVCILTALTAHQVSASTSTAAAAPSLVQAIRVVHFSAQLQSFFLPALFRSFSPSCPSFFLFLFLFSPSLPRLASRLQPGEDSFSLYPLQYCTGSFTLIFASLLSLLILLISYIPLPPRVRSLISYTSVVPTVSPLLNRISPLNNSHATTRLSMPVLLQYDSILDTVTPARPPSSRSGPIDRFL